MSSSPCSFDEGEPESGGIGSFSPNSADEEEADGRETSETGAFRYPANFGQLFQERNFHIANMASSGLRRRSTSFDSGLRLGAMGRTNFFRRASLFARPNRTPPPPKYSAETSGSVPRFFPKRDSIAFSLGSTLSSGTESPLSTLSTSSSLTSSPRCLNREIVIDMSDELSSLSSEVVPITRNMIPVPLWKGCVKKVAHYLWNLKSLVLILVASAIVSSVLPSLILSRSFSLKIVSEGATVRQDMSLINVQLLVEKISGFLIDTHTMGVRSIQYGLIDENVTITDDQENLLDMHRVLIPIATSRSMDEMSSLGFGFNSGGIMILSLRPGGNISRHQTVIINETRYADTVKLDPTSPGFRGVLGIEKSYRQKPYSVTDYPWFSSDKKTSIQWTTMRTYGGWVNLLSHSSIFQNGEFIGKVILTFNFQSVSKILQNFNDEFLFIFSSSGELLGSSSMNQELANEEDSQIYIVNEYPWNSAVRLTGEAIVERFGNYSNFISVGVETMEIKSTITDYRVAFKNFEIEGGYTMVVANVKELAVLHADTKQLSILSWICFLGTFVFSLLIAFLVSCVVGEPLRQVSRRIQDLSALKNLGQKKDVFNFFRISEMNVLNESMQKLNNALLNFAKFLPAKILRKVIERNEEIALHLVKKMITVCFIDMAGFTSMAENLRPENLVDILCVFFDICDKKIRLNGGTIDKYIGDCVMAFWTSSKHARECLNAIADIMKEVEKVKRIKEDAIDIRCGVNTGYALVGFLGSVERIAYTCVGDTINVAARLEQLNRELGTNVLVGERTLELTEKQFKFQFVGECFLKGKTEKVKTFEMIPFWRKKKKKRKKQKKEEEEDKTLEDDDALYKTLRRKFSVVSESIHEK